MTAQPRPHLTLADLADMDKTDHGKRWLSGFTAGSPLMWDELRRFRIAREKKERESQ